LNKSDDADICGISPGLDLDLEILAEGFLLLELSDLDELLRYSDVRQMAARIFSSQYLRLRMVQGHHHENFGIALLRRTVHVEVRAKSPAIRP